MQIHIQTHCRRLVLDHSEVGTIPSDAFQLLLAHFGGVRGKDIAHPHRHYPRPTRACSGANDFYRSIFIGVSRLEFGSDVIPFPIFLS